MLELELVPHRAWGMAWRLRCTKCEQTWTTRLTKSAANVALDHCHGFADLMKISYLDRLIQDAEELYLHD